MGLNWSVHKIYWGSVQFQCPSRSWQWTSINNIRQVMQLDGIQTSLSLLFTPVLFPKSVWQNILCVRHNVLSWKIWGLPRIMKNNAVMSKMHTVWILISWIYFEKKFSELLTSESPIRLLNLSCTSFWFFWPFIYSSWRCDRKQVERERGGVTRSIGPQARARTWGCCSGDKASVHGKSALPPELKGNPILKVLTA